MKLKKRKLECAGGEEGGDVASEDLPNRKKVKVFSMEHFQERLKVNAIAVLTELWSACRAGTDGGLEVVRQFLHGGGRPQQVVALLHSTSEDHSAALVLPVFCTLKHLLLCHAALEKEHQEAVESASRQLLTSHMAVVCKALTSAANAETCITTLNMLSVMVMQSESLAKQILGGVNFTSRQVVSLAYQTSPVTTTVTAGRTTVRTHFLRLIMAFFVSGSVELIRIICSKRGLLGKVLANLTTDAPDTVLLVLRTLHSKLLENAEISDGTKAAALDPLAVRSLLGLYRWVGPDSAETANTQVHEEHREVLAQAVHGLMLGLCDLSGRFITSVRPQSKGLPLYKQCHSLGKIILEELKEPWHDELQCELVQKTLASWPHLLKGFLSRLDGILQPSNSLRWHYTVDLYTRVLESLDPATCLPSPKHATPGTLATLAAPSSVLKAVVGGDSLPRGRLTVRHQACLLLRAVLRAADRLLSSVEARGLLRGHDMDRLRADFTAHLLQFLPTAEVLASTWRQAVVPPRSEERPDGADVVGPPSLQEHLSLLLDMLDAYGRCCPRRLSLDALQPLALLADVRAHCPRLVLKALSVLFSLDPAGFSADKELFKTSVTLLLAEAADHPRPENALPVLVDVLQQTGLFATEPSEPLVWLHCYLDVPPAFKPAVASLLADALTLVAADPPQSSHVASLASRAERPRRGRTDGSLFHILQDLLEGRITGKSVEGEATAGLSPLLPAVLQLAADADKQTAAFVSGVVVHLLHSQASPDQVVHVLDQRPGLVLPTVCKYVRGWLTSGKPAPLSKPFPRGGLERKLSRLVLRPGKSTVEDVFGDLLSSEAPAAVDKLPVRDPFHVLLLLRLLWFHVGQLLARNCVTEKSCGDYRRAVSWLLQSLKVLPMRGAYSGLAELVGDHLRSVLRHPAVLSAFAPGSCAGGLVAGLVEGVVTSAGDMLPRDALAPLRKQLVSSMAASLDGGRGRPGQDLLQTLRLLGADLKDLVHLVERAAAVPSELLVEDGARLSPHGVVLCSLLTDLSAQDGHRCSVVLECTVEKLTQHIISLSGMNVAKLSKLERAFRSFLVKYPHHLTFVHEGVLSSLLLRNGRSSQAVKLCSYLVKSEEKFARELARLAETHEVLSEDAGCVFGLLSAALTHGRGAVPASLLRKVFERHKDLVFDAVVGRANNATCAWPGQRTSIVCAIVETLMDVDECLQLCEKVKARGKVNGRPHLRLLESLFERAAHAGEKRAVGWWCGVLLGAAAAACRRRSGTSAWLQRLCSGLRSCAGRAASSPALTHLEGDDLWWRFATQALSAGLGQAPCMLDALGHLCGAVYRDGLDHSQPVQLFNMLVAHSQFLPVMLDNTRPAKKCVLKLLLVLTSKAPCVMSTSLVATLLESYGASLSITDQLILKLLYQCERGGVGLQKWRPYLWGKAAADQHASHAQLSTALLQEPSVNQVLDLLSPDVVGTTVNYFPLDRQLTVEGQMCRNQPKVYDPAFFLPLLSHVLSLENPLSVSKVPKSGALALCIAALSSNHEPVRRAACHALSRYYVHLEASRLRVEKQVWMQLVDCLREGAGPGGGGGPEVPQLPSVVTVYLARASLVMCSPGSALFAPLVNYLCLWPAFDVRAVPDFVRLFRSSDLEHREHQRFILEVLRAGIRRDADFELAHKSLVYKTLMSFYGSALADQISKVLILRVLQSSVKVPAAAALLVSGYGLLSWLAGVVNGLGRAGAGHAVAVLHLLCDLRGTLAAGMNAATAAHIAALLVALLPKLSPGLRARNLRLYLEALGGLAATARSSGALAPCDVSALLRFCRGVLGPVDEYEYMLVFGGGLVPRKVRGPKSGEVQQARQHLHTFMLAWLGQTCA